MLPASSIFNCPGPGSAVRGSASGALAVVGFLQFGTFGRTLAMTAVAFAITSLEGFLITPALMGGSDNITIAMLIQREVEITVNWSFASALAMTLLAVTLAAFWIYSRFIRLESLLKAAA